MDRIEVSNIAREPEHMPLTYAPVRSNKTVPVPRVEEGGDGSW